MPIFLTIPGVVGDSQVAGYVDAIVIEDMAWGLSNPGTAKADATFADMALAKSIDRASTHLAMAAANGTAFSTATIAHVRAGEVLQEFLTITLTGSRVTSWFQDEDLEEDPPQEQLSMNYEKIEVIYQPFNHLGQPLPTERFAWDLKKNKTF